jgi:hypothetical protein
VKFMVFQKKGDRKRNRDPSDCKPVARNNGMGKLQLKFPLGHSHFTSIRRGASRRQV